MVVYQGHITMYCCEKQTRTVYVRVSYAERRDKKKHRGWEPIGQVCMVCGKFHRIKRLRLSQGMTTTGNIRKDERKRV